MPRISIRAKLVLLSVAMLSIPYVGFQYLRETERYLQSSLEDSLLAVAGAMATALLNQKNLFRSTSTDSTGNYPLFVHSLNYPPHIDGYTDDWDNYKAWSDHFATPGGAAASAPDGFELVVGLHGQTLNLLVEVSDESYVYAQAGTFAPERADTIELVMRDKNSELRRIYLSTAAAGPVTAYSITENWDFSLTRNPVTNIVGAWQETATGYVVEMKMPLSFVGNAIGVVVHDRDIGQEASTRIASARSPDDLLPNELLRTSVQLEQIIARIGLKKGRRVWVINRSGQVLASGGSLSSETKRGAINFLYTWVLPSANETFEDDLKSASRLRGDEVLRALGGQASTRWRSSPDERAVIVSAAHPVRAGNELIGAIVVEETTNSIQTLQRDAMAALFNQSIAVFLGVSLILLIFASRLSYRIGKLRDQADEAIDLHGRVVGEISGSAANDELGDLSRSYSAMLSRLAEYNAYLEGMAGKLSHELRTPLTVVSSSLENLDALSEQGEDARYLNRAREGMSRLHNLVSRLSEAARLEQAVASVEHELFDLSKLVSGCVDGYREAYPEKTFVLQCEPRHQIVGSDDLFAQLLDKLIDNAVGFGVAHKTIDVTLSSDRDHVTLAITNRGSLLPESMQNQIFNSMVSLRDGRGANEPHLGLGLFIARLVVEFHRGEISAFNLADKSGVCFQVTLPRHA